MQTYILDIKTRWTINYHFIFEFFYLVILKYLNTQKGWYFLSSFRTHGLKAQHKNLAMIINSLIKF